jgi:aldose sugar dehydrogenase
MSSPAIPSAVDPRRRATLARLGLLWAAAAAPLVSCGGGGGAAPAVPGGPTPPPPPGSPPPPSSGTPRATVLTSSLQNPWGLAFLPDGRLLVTQKRAGMVVVGSDGSISAPLSGLPAFDTQAVQGGLLDVVLDPDFATPGSNWVYFSYVEPGAGGNCGGAVSRGRLDLANMRLTDVPATPLIRQGPMISRSFGHFGGRLAFRGDKTLFATFGERQQYGPAQDVTNTLGKVVRIHRDGSIPGDNPSLGASAAPGIWSLGHRNPQGAFLHPGTGELWVCEHGPVGGDELNIVRAGQNYGWPTVSYGCDNDGPDCERGGGTHAPTYTEPVSRWPAPGAPHPYQSIAPSGMCFYNGSGFPEWQGSVFLAALAGRALWRVALNGNAEGSREQLFASLGERLRCVQQGPDGWLYVLTDDAHLIRIDR